MELSTEILSTASKCFTEARRNLIEGAAYLYRIKAESLFVGHYSTFGEYVEQECHLSESYASKLLSAYDHFVVKGGVSHAKLANTDPEKLYLASRLPGDLDDQLEKAVLWTRREIRDELASKDGVDCTHPNHVTICATCQKRL